jgi:hypothetical protein
MTTTSTPITPEEFLGYPVGQDRKLVDWPQIVAYFQLLERGSDRVKLVDLGPTTEGNSLIMAIFAAPNVIQNLDRYRNMQARLLDPRVSRPMEAAQIIREGKAPVLITASIHATEVGPTQSSLLVGHRLATAADDETQRILENVILLYIPCLNPDGLRLVKRWYESTIGTPHEGVPPPYPYHRYGDHDNNRDWSMFVLNETRLLVEKVHNVWRPVAVFDQHQMGREAVRMFVPPFEDPYDPNIDPILQQEIAVTGLAIAQELTAHGKTGVAVNCIFDAYTPARQYQNYHGGVRILSEIASAKLATPVEVRPSDLRPSRGIDPRVPSWKHPAPWAGGTWRLSDIVEHNEIATFAFLDHVARYRDRWLHNQRRWAENAVQPDKGPYAFVVPREQRDPGTTAEMIETLHFGMVDVEEASSHFHADGVTYSAGSYIIRLAQTYGPFARTMLEQRSYPDVREYQNGPQKRPYDITAHNLPLLMGVNTAEVRSSFKAEARPVREVRRPIGRVTGDGAGRVFIFDGESNASVRAAHRLLLQGMDVRRAAVPFETDGEQFAAGAYLLSGVDASIAAASTARDCGVRIVGRRNALNIPVTSLRLPRVGLYQPWIPNADEGWTRWIFEQYELPYETLHDADIRQGDLEARLDALILTAEQSTNLIQHGLKEGEYPPEFVGGLGEGGAAAIRTFVEQGGSLIALDSAADWAIEQLALPVQNVLKGVGTDEFYAPGSILRVVLETDHPLAYGMPRACNAMFLNSPAFEVHEGAIVGRYPLTDPLLCGWLHGGEKLFGRAAIVEVPVGMGRVILLGFRAQFRAQARGTFRLLFNATFRSVMREE